VNELVDPLDLAEAREAGLRTATSERVVAAVISECARDGQATTLPSSGRSALLSDARVLFVVTEADQVDGFHYESDGARTATWRESVGTTGLP
jgi:hypothetical protein